jgi:hypothetical protein
MPSVLCFFTTGVVIVYKTGGTMIAEYRMFELRNAGGKHLLMQEITGGENGLYRYAGKTYQTMEEAMADIRKEFPKAYIKEEGTGK